MKKIIIIILLSIINIFNTLPKYQVSSTSEYARALESTNLYKLTDNDNINNILCIVEKSYFVEIISTTDNYYKVNYNGVQGFVKKNEVCRVLNTPSTPFPYNIKIIINSDCNLRSSPSIKSSTNNILTTINSGESNITFIGRIFSEEAIDFGGTTWYYVNFQGNYGYIYNKYVRSITPIYENTEISTPLTESHSTDINPITHTPSLFIIIILLIPCIFILIILYLPRKTIKKIKPQKSPKIIDKY